MPTTYVDEMLDLIARRHMGHQFTTRWVSRSHFSSIVCVENGTGRLVIKAVMPWHLEAMPPNERASAIAMLNGATIEFRNQLLRHHVKLADTYDILTEDGYIYHVSSYAGEPGDALMMALDGPARVTALRQIVASVAGVLHQARPECVGLDAQLSNFGMLPSGDGYEVRYLDVFPPLVKYHDEYLVHYPNPTDESTLARELQRKFSVFGILRRMRFSVMSIDANLEDPFDATLRDILDPMVYREVAGHFEVLPDAAIKNGFDPKTIRDMIASIQYNGIDDIRDVAMRLAQRSETPRTAFLDETFDLSRIDPSPGYEEPHEVRFDKLRRILISLV